jgi:hypothetical protein
VAVKVAVVMPDESGRHKRRLLPAVATGSRGRLSAIAVSGEEVPAAACSVRDRRLGTVVCGNGSCRAAVAGASALSVAFMGEIEMR